jgi:hypothetical protein
VATVGITGAGTVIIIIMAIGTDHGATIAGIIGAGAAATVIMDFTVEVSMVQVFMAEVFTLHTTITTTTATIITATEAMHDRMAEEVTTDLAYIVNQL